MTIAASAMLGLIVETGALRAGLFAAASQGLSPILAPLWLIGLWAAFGTLLQTAFRPVERRPILAALLGAIFGPAAYIAGDRIGALRIIEPFGLHLAALALIWAITLPLLLTIEQRLPE